MHHISGPVRVHSRPRGADVLALGPRRRNEVTGGDREGHFFLHSALHRPDRVARKNEAFRERKRTLGNVEMARDGELRSRFRLLHAGCGGYLRIYSRRPARAQWIGREVSPWPESRNRAENANKTQCRFRFVKSSLLGTAEPAAGEIARDTKAGKHEERGEKRERENLFLLVSATFWTCTLCIAPYFYIPL